MNLNSQWAYVVGNTMTAKTPYLPTLIEACQLQKKL